VGDEYPLYSPDRTAATTASSASGAVRKEGEEEGSPWLSGITGRGLRSSKHACSWRRYRWMLFSPAAATAGFGLANRHVLLPPPSIADSPEQPLR
jgi:hypothetical protein